ncbi:phosphatase PAP2 family protein, partial [Streptomyces sp. NPDC058067]|uniref:phosphatase PAP2 family protein n=1 Tax=Streptomyces sp. NPDC058067 TaxID=3346324 RepID=UPI0036E63977
MTVVALAWLGWRSWRGRELRPLLVFLMALVLLNVSVGAVKLGTGRVGPGRADVIGSGELFRGGDVFPSGHTANSVVIWGTFAYLASRHRRVAVVVAVVVAGVVGLTTVYLGTHWFSDALGGWAAGGLVLLVLPWCEPFVGRVSVWCGRFGGRLVAGCGRWPGVVVVVSVSVSACRRVGGGGGGGGGVVGVGFRCWVWNVRGPPGGFRCVVYALCC